jgi:hypothetical protein
VVDFRNRYLPSTSLITASANLLGPSIPSHVGIQLRHRININIFQTNWEMCAARNTSGALALLLPLYAKFMNICQKNTQYFNMHYSIAQYLCNRVTISRYREGDLHPIMGDTQLFPSHRCYLAKNTESVIKKVLRPQRVPHRDHCLSGRVTERPN